MCRLCDNGFSTKANCVRHVQKQHPEVEGTEIEAMIHVNDTLYHSGKEKNMVNLKILKKECSNLNEKSSLSHNYLNITLGGEESNNNIKVPPIVPIAHRPEMIHVPQGKREFHPSTPPTMALRTPPPNMMGPVMQGFSAFAPFGMRSEVQ